MPKYRATYSRGGILDFAVTAQKGRACLAVGSYRHAPEVRIYEVHLLRMKKSRRDSSDAGEMILSSPSESEWGKYGWTYLTLEAAEVKYCELMM